MPSALELKLKLLTDQFLSLVLVPRRVQIAADRSRCLGHLLLLKPRAKLKLPSERARERNLLPRRANDVIRYDKLTTT